jgi:murein DD-endopeptidase MepM/ murein hydrolase activator NlpD
MTSCFRSSGLLLFLCACGTRSIPTSVRASAAPARASVSTAGPEVAAVSTLSAAPSVARPLLAPPSPTLPTERVSGVLRNPQLRSPLPGGVFAGYAGDTGLDLAADHQPVYAIADGVLEYSEPGHTVWSGGKDTPNSIRIRLDLPITHGTRHITHAYYTHLSQLRYAMREGEDVRIHVVAGQQLGISGVGRGSAHLHIGLLTEGQVDQASWNSLLTERHIRDVFGGYRTGECLP